MPLPSGRHGLSARCRVPRGGCTHGFTADSSKFTSSASRFITDSITRKGKIKRRKKLQKKNLLKHSSQKGNHKEGDGGACSSPPPATALVAREGGRRNEEDGVDLVADRSASPLRSSHHLHLHLPLRAAPTARRRHCSLLAKDMTPPPLRLPVARGGRGHRTCCSPTPSLLLLACCSPRPRTPSLLRVVRREKG